MGRYPDRGSKKTARPASEQVRPIRPGKPFDSFGPARQKSALIWKR
jgi:hypothetical protein